MKELEGQTLAGRYRILEMQKQDAALATFTVHDKRTGTMIFMKTPSRIAMQDPEMVARFKRQCELLQRIDNPHVVKYLAHGEENDILYLLTRYESGRSVLAYIGVAGTLSPHLALGILKQAAQALITLHDNNIVLRALSPEILLITPEGRVVLLDFTSAKATGGEDLTRPGFAPMGNLAYMAPEVLNGNAERRSDVYSLGAVLFPMLTGRPPFEETQPLQLAMSIMKQSPPKLRAVSSIDSEELERFLERCLQKDPADRFHSVDETLEAIEQFRTVSPASQEELQEELLGIPLEKLAGGKFWLVHEASGTSFPLEGSVITIGRGSDRDVILEDVDPQKYVHRKHARMERRGPNWVIITERGAKNGVWVNGRRLAIGEETMLNTGDEIRLANVALRLMSGVPKINLSGLLQVN
ncbi:MAG: FHA domain-containing serine/threonine-protein kinase [Chloroflexota bacterium]